jgi:putative ABC transport system substrate-binding protein
MTEVRNQTPAVSNNGTPCALVVSPALLLGGPFCSSLNLIADLRLLISVFCALLFALCASVEAQQPRRILRIGYLAVRSGTGALDDAVKTRLRELGYVEGKNISFAQRWADGHFERLPALAEELVRLNVDVIVTETSAAAQAAKTATHTIPIVMASGGDAVAVGLVASLSHPGGNVTGMTFLGTDLAPKWVELLKEIVPRTSSIGFFAMTTMTPEPIFFKAMEPEAQRLRMAIGFFDVTGPKDYEEAFRKMKQAGIDGVIVAPNTAFAENKQQIIRLAAQHRFPTLYSRRDQAEAGGLISYGQNYPEMHRRAAEYVDKILRGTKPADLPVERLSKFEMVINLKTATQIGLTVPPNVLARADKVIK